jgi:micrococcal nuclease
MHKERVRLYGIDTPESRTRDLDEKKYGLIAKDMIKKFMPVDSFQTLITEKDKSGKYGRILGKFKVNDGNYDIILNDWMITNHHAVAYFGQSKGAIAEEHLVNRGHVDQAMEEN